MFKHTLHNITLKKTRKFNIKFVETVYIRGTHSQTSNELHDLAVDNLFSLKRSTIHVPSSVGYGAFFSIG
jgi:hypothetical protein